MTDSMNTSINFTQLSEASCQCSPNSLDMTILGGYRERQTRDILEAYHTHRSGQRCWSHPSLSLSEKDVDFLASGVQVVSAGSYFLQIIFFCFSGDFSLYFFLLFRNFSISPFAFIALEMYPFFFLIFTLWVRLDFMSGATSLFLFLSQYISWEAAPFPVFYFLPELVRCFRYVFWVPASSTFYVITRVLFRRGAKLSWKLFISRYRCLYFMVSLYSHCWCSLVPRVCFF